MVMCTFFRQMVGQSSKQIFLATVDVFCDSGGMVISGGCDISDLNYPWALQRTLPILNVATAEDPRNPRDGWSCTYNNVSGLRTPAIQIKAMVICADLTP